MSYYHINLKATFFSILLLTTAAQSAIGQLSVEDDSTAESYVKNILLGDGVELVKVTFVGKKGSLGSFKADTSLFGMSEGLILTTGAIKGVIGPNRHPGKTSTGILPVSGTKRRIIRKGDKDLNAISPAPTLDNAILQIDFIPQFSELEFNYIFGSEEYLEYCGSQYNDIFGFFLSGPTVKKKNLAVLPDGKTPVSVNTINHKTNSQYYVRNDYIKVKGKKLKRQEKIFAKKYEKIDRNLNQSVELDGMTTILTAKAEVEPGKLYRIKLCIADGSDASFDSAVFIEGGSFSSIPQEDEIVLNKPPAKVDKLKKLVHVNRRVRFKTLQIHYETNSHEWSDSSLAPLDSLIQILNSCPDCMIVIEGHTDDVGADNYNLKLSENRAKSIFDYMTNEGVDPKRMEYKGFGPTHPLVPNDSEEGRATNRRVEIRLVDH